MSDTTDPAVLAASDMRQRAANVAMTRGVVPCLWLAHTIASEILALPLTATGQRSDDLEALRQRVVVGCERIMHIRIGVSAAERRMAAAQAQFWQGASGDELQRLSDLLANTQSEEDKP